MSKFAWTPGQSLQIKLETRTLIAPYSGPADGLYADTPMTWATETTYSARCLVAAIAANGTVLYEVDDYDKDGNHWYYAGGSYHIGNLSLGRSGNGLNLFWVYFGVTGGGRGTVYTNNDFKLRLANAVQNTYYNGINAQGNAPDLNAWGGFYNAVEPHLHWRFKWGDNPTFNVWDFGLNGNGSIDIEPVINSGVKPEDKDPNGRWGNSGKGGGKGTRENPPGKFKPGGDAVPSRFADDSAVNSGFMTVFVPTLAQINSLATYLWNEQPGNLDKIKKLFADPMDVILGLHVLPFNISTVGQKEIMPGTLASGVTANYTTKQYYTKDMGSITVEEHWGSCLDYAPYTRVNIFLPFIGTRTLDTDVVMGQTLHLYYTVEVTTGSLLAQIEIAGNVVYEFSGNCAMSIPVSASDYRNAVQAAIGLAATIGAGIASGGSAAAPVAAATGVTEAAAGAGITAATVASIGAATANAVLNSKPTIERTGSLGGAAGYMGVQKPYLIIEYPDQCLPEDYMIYNGYPSYITEVFGNLTGYTQCETVRFKSGRATEEERKEIIQWLQSGVVLGGTAPTKPSAVSAGIGLTGYQNGSEDLIVNKTLSLALATQTVYLKKDTEITRPTIILSADTINFNYCYIDAFDRFYYVTGVRNIGADRWEVDLRVDSLTSFSTDISNSSGVISRQENDWNLYIDDGTFKVYQNRNIYIYNFTGEFTERSYILLVAGS